MSVLDLFRTRAIDASDFALDTDFGSKTDSGITVDGNTAMQLVSAYACVTLIADSVRSMPVDVFRDRNGERTEVPKPSWMVAPNPEQSWGQFLDYAMNSLLIAGNVFLLASSRDTAGFPSELWVIHPDDVKVSRENRRKLVIAGPDQRKLSVITGSNPLGEVLHVMGHTADGLIGVSPVEKAAESIGWGLATEKFGNKFFGQGATPGGVVEMPAGSNPTEPQLTQLGRDFRRKYSGTDNAWKPIVLANGASFKPISIPNDQAQFIESRKFSVSEIARLYRVPPHMIGDVERSTSWGSGIEEQGIGFVTYTLMPWITRLEEALSLLLPRGQYVKFNANALLRGDQKGRYEAYQLAVTNGILTRNEVRLLEELEPLDGLDEPLTPLNMNQGQPDV